MFLGGSDDAAIRPNPRAASAKVHVAPDALRADAIHRIEEHPDGICRRRQLRLPHRFGDASASGSTACDRQLGAVRSQSPPYLGKVALVTDADADPPLLRVEHGCGVAGFEIGLQPEAL